LIRTAGPEYCSFITQTSVGAKETRKKYHKILRFCIILIPRYAFARPEDEIKKYL
jgi:hypothetical protein